MKYVFDTSAFIQLFRKGNYDREIFPTLWDNFDELVRGQRVISVREVRREIDQTDDLASWSKEHAELFYEPNENQTRFIRELFVNPHFQGLVKHKKIVGGGREADPFVIACAHDISGRVVTQEKNKPNAPCIPTICEHYDIQCVDLVGFMQKENWKF